MHSQLGTGRIAKEKAHNHVELQCGWSDSEVRLSIPTHCGLCVRKLLMHIQRGSDTVSWDSLA